MPGHLIRRLQQVAVAVFHAEVGEAGSDLTPVQYAALTTVAERPAIDQATLARLIAYDRTTIGGVVDRLVQKGLLARAVNDRDRRAHVLRVTQQGLDHLEAIGPAVENAQRLMVRALSADEAEQLLRLMRKAISAADEPAPAAPRSPTEA